MTNIKNIKCRAKGGVASCTDPKCPEKQAQAAEREKFINTSIAQVAQASHPAKTAASTEPSFSYGPQHENVENLTGRTLTMSMGEAKALKAAMSTARNEQREDAEDAVWGNAQDSDRGEASDAAMAAVNTALRRTAHDADWRTARIFEWNNNWNGSTMTVHNSDLSSFQDRSYDSLLESCSAAAQGAASALVVRDLLNAEQYDTLTGPWRKNVGRIHPDDADLMP
jgi:hypothetical protein